MKKHILSVGLDPLLHFEAIARLRSLKKAADELRLSQPAVTQSLGKLEKSLGVQLCVRSRSAFALTEAGHRLFQIGKAIKTDLVNYEKFLRDDEEFDGLFSVGVIDNFQNKAVEEAIAKTISRYPKMKLSLQVHAATEIQQLLSSGEIDIGLGIFNRKQENLTYRAIGTETIHHYISENHPLWKHRDADELKGQVKTWVDIINRDRAALEAEIFSESKRPNIRSYANNLNTAVLILRSGTSIVPLPAEYLESRKLDFKFRALAKAFPPYTLKQEVASHREFRNASPASKYFLGQL